MFDGLDISTVVGEEGKLHLDLPGIAPGQKVDVSIRPQRQLGGWHKPGRATAPPPPNKSLRREAIYEDD
ncbi:hypothetical protein BH11ARM2_BH11ARM2_14430 [soil metagenome]